jgi:hypothetical protein
MGFRTSAARACSALSKQGPRLVVRAGFYEAGTGFAGVRIPSAAGIIVILADPANDGFMGLAETAVLVEPDLFLFQAAAEALDQPVAFR